MPDKPNVIYIKLGSSDQSEWNKWLMDKNLLWMSFADEVPKEEELDSFVEKNSKKTLASTDSLDYPGVGKKDLKRKNALRQLRLLSEATENDFFITFYKDPQDNDIMKMFYCRPKGKMMVFSEGYPKLDNETPEYIRKNDNKVLQDTRFRATDGWTSVNGQNRSLVYGYLPGAIQAKMMFQGTACILRDDDLDICLHLISGKEDEELGELRTSISDEKYLIEVPDKKRREELIYKFIKRLGPSEFEAFVDMLFLEIGWHKYGGTGGNQYAVDIVQVSDDKKERNYIQVKGEVDRSALNEAIQKMKSYGVAPGTSGSVTNHLIIAYHTPKGNLEDIKDKNKNSDIKFLDFSKQDQVYECCHEKENKNELNHFVIEWLRDVSSMQRLPQAPSNKQK